MKLEFHKGPFFESIVKVNKNKKNLFYVIGIDIIFLITLFVLASAFNILGKNVGITTISQAFIFSIVNILAVLFIYSLFKYIVLSIVKSAFNKHKINFERLGKFYLLNIILFLILFIAFILLSFFAASIKDSIAPVASLIILVAYILLSYSFINIIHVLFYEGRNVKEGLDLGAKSFGKIKNYYGTYLVILTAIAIILALFGIFGNALGNTLFQDYNALLKYGNAYTIAFVHAVGVILYLAVIFNRFYFYSIVKHRLFK